MMVPPWLRAATGQAFVRFCAAALVMLVAWSSAPPSMTGSSVAQASRGQSTPAVATPTIAIDTPMPAPAWALAERAVLAANGEGVAAFAAKYVDGNGHLRGPAHWGISDGPDDAVEPIRNWPLAHALGGDDSIIETWDRVWEGHLDQYSRTTVPEVEVARDGIYYREFTPSFDWEHIGEGLSGFYWYGLSRPTDPRYEVRLRRFSGFYMNEDPAAANYDPALKIVRSLWNGSRGPKLTPATPDDWDGPAYPGVSEARRTRFLEASNIRGDHPLNLGIANLPFHAYLVTGDEKYRNWLLEYVGAWRDRIRANDGNIPSNIGLDGAIGGEWGGKWYGGVFGWNSPDKGVRNYVFRGPPEAFGDALLLTGDKSWADVLRRQIDNLYAAKKVENGKVLIPHYYGDDGWYGYSGVDDPSPGLSNRRQVQTDLYLWGLRQSDKARLPPNPWLDYLESGEPGYPLQAFQDALDEIRVAHERLRHDDSTYDFPVGSTRWSRANPVATTALINLTLGGNDPGGSGHGPLPLHTQLRYFDPERRRAGLSRNVAALVQRITPESVVLTLVNTSPFHARTVTVQMGAYGEHTCTTVEQAGRVTPVNASSFTVRLAPGAGQTLTVGVQRYANSPTLAFPWDRGWMTHN